MKTARAAIALCALGSPGAALAQDADLAVRNQWFTGSLEASSPALSTAGTLAIEPYLIYKIDTRAYDDQGHRHSGGDGVHQMQSVTVVKYALTDRLSFQALPTVVRVTVGHDPRGLGIADLPVELEYRLKDENGRTGSPSITASAGMVLPIGRYDQLTTALDGLGTGGLLAKQGIVVESLFDTKGGHPVRIRLFASVTEALASADVRDLSVYGSADGFVGHATPGVSAQVGLAAGYAIDQRWVVALDVVRSDAGRSRLTGVDASGTARRTTGLPASRTILAPALEYNWSARAGLIAGVELSVAGRNTPAYVAPQIAVALAF
ncbi:hypothetical protein [Sphingomonas sp. 10B4]|uniref:hypothetical protein n=1 Tax=Sphingomonas sp. 10B4 TaxID=3048575 RepID=UPI002AB5934D|nr:hypothetical protein [Sphingomonas sp. 10B4]MDY7523639.1 hypothetical protein [Sphingomonas sp. 10B4]MEB0283961.1 hypothetical protein [Sphingomonas sp. 10B4]